MKIRAMAKFPLENPNPIMRVGPNGAIEFANESALRLLKRLDAQYELRVPACLKLKGWMVDTIEKRSIPEEQLVGRVRELVKTQT
ncbi:MAG: hypothetical protein E2P02_05175 [Acidobacteria bacterium]|nr:MAG: hypothetical protein E2P02_05175 [Acidobacteriota bacterium]